MLQFYSPACCASLLASGRNCVSWCNTHPALNVWWQVRDIKPQQVLKILRTSNLWNDMLTLEFCRPNKPRNGGTVAGFARAGPGRDRDSTVGNGVDSSEEVRQPGFDPTFLLAHHHPSCDLAVLQPSLPTLSPAYALIIVVY